MSFNQQAYSKEAIKSRMQQNATKLWGVKNIQSLDPFVKLLIDAFSTEVFKANNEIQTINGRILEKLARMLTPAKYTHPSPAHAIAFCMPDEDREILMSHAEFFVKKQLSSFRKNQPDRQLEIPLTPVDHIQLINAQTLFMAAGHTVYHIDEQMNKIAVSRMPSDPDRFRRMKIGIDFSRYASGTPPERLSFYCANPTYERVGYLYKLLPHIKVSCNGTALTVQPGLTYNESIPEEGFRGIFEEQSLQYKICADIKSLYQHKFIEVSGFTPHLFEEMTTGVPEDIHQGNPIFLSYQDKKILWLDLEFPPQFTAEILENFLFVLNAFPVYNRGWKKTEYSLDIMGNNIPLETTEDEHFLYVEELTDGLGKTYHEIPFTPDEEMEKGLYTVRKGGMERFTNRNAIDLIAYVMELLRDEVAAFSIINRDKVKDVLSEISDKMKGLMKKVELANKELKEDINYVIIEPLENSAHTYAAFWVTQSALANGIRPGTEFNSQKKLQSITLLTETTGGAQEKKQSDTILAYKYALTTRDKIISIEDVKNYCRMMLRDEMKSITVKRGIMISEKPNEGFIRTIDISIEPQNYTFYGKSYWDAMAETLKHHIKSKAIDGLEYRIAIKDEGVIAE